MTKKQAWNSLSERWRKAVRRTVERWVRHVNANGKARGRTNCYLCDEARREGTVACPSCPVSLQQGSRFRKEMIFPCFMVVPFAKWWADETKGQPRLSDAKGVLRYLLGFLPKNDPLRKPARKALK